MSPNNVATRHTGQFQSERATSAPNNVVMSMVPTTEAPYAADSALELPKPITNRTTATNMNRLAAGT